MDTSALTNSIKAITINHPNHFVAVDSNNDMFFWHNTPSTWKPFNKKAKMIFSEPESAKIYRVIENDSLYMCTPDYGSIMPETWVWEQIGGTVKTIATYNDKLYAITTDANKTIHRYISPNHWEIIGGSGQSLCVTDQHKVFASTKSTGGGAAFIYQGTPHKWTVIPNSNNTKAIVANDQHCYVLKENGDIFKGTRNGEMILTEDGEIFKESDPAVYSLEKIGDAANMIFTDKYDELVAHKTDNSVVSYKSSDRTWNNISGVAGKAKIMTMKYGGIAYVPDENDKIIRYVSHPFPSSRYWYGEG